MESTPQTQTAVTNRLVSYLALFTSVGTLLCCALPSLLVLLGLGATVASFLSAAPWLVTLSRHKNWVFGVSGGLILGNLFYMYRVAPGLKRAGTTCPADAPEACAGASRVNRVILWVSVAIYSVGLFSAYALGPLLMRFG